MSGSEPESGGDYHTVIEIANSNNPMDSEVQAGYKKNREVP